MTKNWQKKIIVGTAILSTIALAPAVFAQTVPTQYSSQGNHTWQAKHGMAFGSITAINGASLTLQGKNGTNYTIDATNATVTVNGQASTLSSLAVGNQIMVQGQPSTADATQITAQTIREGMMNRGDMRGKGQYRGGENGHPPSTNKTQRVRASSMFQQVLTVTSMNGTTVTATGSNGVTYTVDLSNAKIVREFGATSSVAEMSIGDSIRVFAPLPVAGSDSVSATNVRNMSVQERNTLVGTIQSLTSSGFTLLTRNNDTYNVTLSSSTVYRNNVSQNTATGLNNLGVGNTVRVFGLTDTTTKTNVASAIRLMNISSTSTPIQQ